MWSPYKLQARAWASNPFAKSEFVTSILFLVVLSSIATNGQGNASIISLINIQIVAQITILSVMNGAMYSFGFLFYEMKQSVLLKRIGATRISKPIAVISFVLWGLTMMLMNIIWISLWVIICSALPQNSLGGILWIEKSFASDINWLAVILGVGITGLAYLPIAFFFVSIAKNAEIYNIIATFYYFLFGFLGGQIVSSSGHLWMEVIGYLSPMSWTTNLVTLGMVGNNFDIPVSWVGATNMNNIAPEIQNVLSLPTNWTSIGLVQLGIPLVFSSAAALASLKTFKWDR